MASPIIPGTCYTRVPSELPPSDVEFPILTVDDGEKSKFHDGWKHA